VVIVSKRLRQKNIIEGEIVFETVTSLGDDMGKRRYDEWITQLNITNLLNKITKTNSESERQRLRDQLYEWTHGFWFQKFKLIREILKTEDRADSKCHRIVKVLDTPRRALDNLR
jgi:hypothetical protein